MKEIISVRSNAFYSEADKGKGFELKPSLELVIIHTDGYDHEIVKDKLVQTVKLSEVRMIVGNQMLQDLITDLQLHQKNLEGYRKNADQINSLIRHIQVKE